MTNQIEGFVGNAQSRVSERALLLEHLPQGGRMLEIGTYHGVTAAVLATARPDAMIDSIDPFTQGYSVKTGDIECWRQNAQSNQRLFVCDSQEFLADGQVERAFGELYDLVFVDGSHARIDCLIDLIVAERLLREGGVIGVHDAGENGEATVEQAVQDFLRLRPEFRGAHQKRTMAILEGVA